MGRTVRELLDSLDAIELNQWRILCQRDPIPNPWLQHGILCSVVARVAGNKNAKPDQFIPRARRLPAMTRKQVNQAIHVGIEKLIAAGTMNVTNVTHKLLEHHADGGV